MSNDKKAVRILNPRPGGHTHTSAKLAIRYIRRGMARAISDTTIQFIEADLRCLSVSASAAAGLRKRLSNGSGFATLDQLAGLPVIKPVILLYGKRTTPPMEDWSA